MRAFGCVGLSEENAGTEGATQETFHGSYGIGRGGGFPTVLWLDPRGIGPAEQEEAPAAPVVPTVPPP